MKKFRVKVFVRGTATKVVTAEDEQDAQRIAEDVVADELPTGFGGLVKASKPKPAARRARSR